jgi:hypothetical protein
LSDLGLAAFSSCFNEIQTLFDFYGTVVSSFHLSKLSVSRNNASSEAIRQLSQSVEQMTTHNIQLITC